MVQAWVAQNRFASNPHHANKAIMPDAEKPEPMRTSGSDLRQPDALRRGWTTGACATAATKAALQALLTGAFPDPVSITLPKGETPAFALARERLDGKSAMAAIIKDAGDDPDVTHGALVGAEIRLLPSGSGIVFKAGPGVGMVTKAGLPVPPGEPAINPVPRAMMRAEAEVLCAAHGVTPDLEITLSIENGAELALKTWNPRLGIVGGLSVLGTTGIVHPFSCSAWIHSIHRGIDVARAAGLPRIIAATGSASENAAQAIHHLPEFALIDMGDFAGGMLKYLRVHPVSNLTLAGGFAKMVKLAQGALDLHSGRSQVDHAFLAQCARAAAEKAGLSLDSALEQRILIANTALEVLEMANALSLPLAAEIAARALAVTRETLRDAPVNLEILICGRDGTLLARAENPASNGVS
jgi:cobalt-precorrin-5B (C1)-methyltransferase